MAAAGFVIRGSFQPVLTTPAGRSPWWARAWCGSCPVMRKTSVRTVAAVSRGQTPPSPMAAPIGHRRCSARSGKSGVWAHRRSAACGRRTIREPRQRSGTRGFRAQPSALSSGPLVRGDLGRRCRGPSARLNLLESRDRGSQHVTGVRGIPAGVLDADSDDDSAGPAVAVDRVARSAVGEEDRFLSDPTGYLHGSCFVPVLPLVVRSLRVLGVVELADVQIDPT